jgi:hypothetical protein
MMIISKLCLYPSLVLDRLYPYSTSIIQSSHITTLDRLDRQIDRKKAREVNNQIKQIIMKLIVQEAVSIFNY